jgi:antitoxin component of RelBE/YafQ-DinJ toxin-antitoxin module
MEFTIKMNPRKKEAKALLEYLKNLPFVALAIEKPRYNAETEKAIREARTGKTHSTNLEALRKQLYS